MKRDPSIPATLKKLLLARDVALVDQGVELVRSMGDVALYAALLRGVTWTPADPSTGEDRTSGTLSMRGSYFEDTAPATVFRTRAVLALAAAAPPECEAATALKGAVTALHFDNADGQSPVTHDLAPLAAFTKLERLTVSGRIPCVGAAALEGHPSLRALDWMYHPLATLPDLTKLPALSSLKLAEIKGAVWPVVCGLVKLEVLHLFDVPLKHDLSLEAFASLRALRLGHTPVRTLSLRGCAALSWLGLDDDPIETVDLAGCDALETLDLSDCPSLRAVSGFEALGSLQTLNVRNTPTDWMPATPTPTLSRLTRVALSRCDVKDVSRFVGLPALSHLAIRDTSALRDVSALRTMKTLREVDLSYCYGVSDVSPLVGIGLKRLGLNYTGVAPNAVPLGLRRVVRWR